jgi:hypothetical protein
MKWKAKQTENQQLILSPSDIFDHKTPKLKVQTDKYRESETSGTRNLWTETSEEAGLGVEKLKIL